jgi:hypothetical protein
LEFPQERRHESRKCIDPQSLSIAPLFGAVRPNSCQSFPNKYAASIASVPQRNIHELAVVSVGSSKPTDRVSGAHQTLQTISRGHPLLTFAGAAGIGDFRRVNSTEAPFYATLPASIAIDKARRAGTPVGTDWDGVAFSVDGARVEQARIKPIAGEGHGKWNRKADEKYRDQQEPKQSAVSVAVLGGVRDFAVGESPETVPIRKLNHTSRARACFRVNGTDYAHVSTDSLLRTI